MSPQLARKMGAGALGPQGVRPDHSDQRAHGAKLVRGQERPERREPDGADPLLRRRAGHGSATVGATSLVQAASVLGLGPVLMQVVEALGELRLQ